MKKKYLIILVLIVLCLVGCGKKEETKNGDSPLAKVKSQMMDKLQNYSYDVTMTTETGIMDIETTMNCTDDLKNKLTHCVTETFGIEQEMYYDYNRKVSYAKTSSAYGYGDQDWTKSELTNDSNTWLDLSDYIFDLKSESRNGGTYYTGVIDGKKLAASMSQTDSSANYDSIVGNNINIEIFVNSSNYIETLNFDMEMMGMKETVKVIFKDYNSAGSISLPSNLK